MNYVFNKALGLSTNKVPLSFHCTEDQIDIEDPRPTIKVLIGYVIIQIITYHRITLKIMNTSQKNQNYLFHVGVDLSKAKFDAVLLSSSKEQQHRVFDNSKSGIKRIIAWLEGQKGFNIQQALICMEHTGLYSIELVKELVQIKGFVWLESSLQN